MEIYIPNPLRCYHCQKFGHAKDRCTRTPMCIKYSKSDANKTNISQTAEKNTADSKDCEMWEKGKEILIKYTQNIPFPEARKIEATKYADVSKKNNSNTSIPSCQKYKTAKNTPTIINTNEINQLINEMKNLLTTIKSFISTITISENLPSKGNSKTKSNNFNQKT